MLENAIHFISNILSFRYGGFALGMSLPTDLKLDLKEVPKNRTLSKVNPHPASLFQHHMNVITNSHI